MQKKGMRPKNYNKSLCNSDTECLFGMVFYVISQSYSNGVDWFRQQDQWVSKHAENRSAISLIPCYSNLTGDQEFALAA